MLEEGYGEPQSCNVIVLIVVHIIVLLPQHCTAHEVQACIMWAVTVGYDFVSPFNIFVLQNGRNNVAGQFTLITSLSWMDCPYALIDQQTTLA